MMFLKAVIEYLEDNGVGTFGADLFGSQYPSSSPDRCVLVRESGGPPPTKYVPVETRIIQFISRAEDYPTAEEVAMDIFELFHGAVSGTSWQSKHNYKVGCEDGEGEYHVLSSWALQMPLDISPDPKGRSEVSLNIAFKIRL